MKTDAYGRMWDREGSKNEVSESPGMLQPPGSNNFVQMVELSILPAPHTPHVRLIVEGLKAPTL